jgi:Tfp pilus assembly pilus retraction ATPase PilT
MQIGKSQGMQTFDDALRTGRRGRISGETAYLRGTKKEDFEQFLPAAPGGCARVGERGRRERRGSARIDRFLRLMTEPRRLRLPHDRGAPPMLRVSGSMEPIRYRTLSEADFTELMKPIVRSGCGRSLSRRATSTSLRDRGRRALPRERVPPAARLGRGVPRDPLEDHDARAARHARQIRRWRDASGLVLVTGPTGSGKSTTLAAIIDLINETRRLTSSRSRTRSSSCTRTRSA